MEFPPSSILTFCSIIPQQKPFCQPMSLVRHYVSIWVSDVQTNRSTKVLLHTEMRSLILYSTELRNLSKWLSELPFHEICTINLFVFLSNTGHFLGKCKVSWKKKKTIFSLTYRICLLENMLSLTFLILFQKWLQNCLYF